MPKIINKEVIEKKQSEKDKDTLIADLLLENGELNQRIADMELIVADLMGGV